MNDNQCGGPRGGGFCEHYHPLKLARYLTILLHLFSELNFDSTILYSQCVCNPGTPTPLPPSPPICKKGNPCIDDKHCGKSGTCVKKPGAGFGFWNFGY